MTRTMKDKASRPWAYTQIHQRSSTLFECVARVDFLKFSELTDLIDANSTGLLSSVARWRVEQPLLYAELIQCMEVQRPSRIGTFRQREQVRAQMEGQ